MTISFVGSNTGTTTATPPTHQIGDLILVFASRSQSATAPSLGSGYTSIGTKVGTTQSSRTGYLMAVSTSDAGGTWTNATEVCYQVYRSTSAVMVMSTFSFSSSNNITANVVYAAIAHMYDASNTSWITCFAGANNTTMTVNTPAPAGMTNRTAKTSVTGRSAGFDTNGTKSLWASANAIATGTAGAWTSWVIEITDGAQNLGGFDVRNIGRGTTAGWTLSNNDLTATMFSTAGKSPFSTTSLPVGAKGYIEFFCINNAGATGDTCGPRIAYANSTGSTDYLVWNPIDGIYNGSTTLVLSGFTHANSAWLGIAVDSSNQKMWFKNITTGSGWNNAAIGSQDPANNIGGLTWTTGAFPLYFAIGTDPNTTGMAYWVNTGAVQPFQLPPPIGFQPWYQQLQYRFPLRQYLRR